MQLVSLLTDIFSILISIFDSMGKGKNVQGRKKTNSSYNFDKLLKIPKKKKIKQQQYIDNPTHNVLNKKKNTLKLKEVPPKTKTKWILAHPPLPAMKQTNKKKQHPLF